MANNDEARRKVQILPDSKPAAQVPGKPANASAKPVTVDVARFWQGGNPPSVSHDVEAVASPTSLLERLGPFPDWQGKKNLIATLIPVYKKAKMLAK